jgi:hypothetical protein
MVASEDSRLLLFAGSGAIFGEPSHEPGSLSQENGPEPLESPGASSSKVVYMDLIVDKIYRRTKRTIHSIKVTDHRGVREA